MFSKRILCCLFGLLAAAYTVVAETELRTVPFVLGPTNFNSGDSITITSVEATSPHFAPGDRVRVRGEYRLASERPARISLFVTAKQPRTGSGLTSPKQTVKASNETGTFDLECEVKDTGFLHVSFYPAKGGYSFGGVYFGTTTQMEEMKQIGFSRIASRTGLTRK